MKQADFEVLIERIRKETTELLVTKGHEYAGDADRLANFKRGATLTGIDPLTVLFIYMSKHYDAFSTYVKALQRGEAPELSEPITGRLADMINYCVLAWALIEEKKVPPEQSHQELTFHQEPVPAAPRVRIRAITGQTALLDGPTRDEFLLALNRRPIGTSLIFEGSQIVAWCYEQDTVWIGC